MKLSVNKYVVTTKYFKIQETHQLMIKAIVLRIKVKQSGFCFRSLAELARF